MEKISALITTYNNEKTIAQCLASLTWVDEIIVLDSYSTDNTVVIAESFDAAIFQHHFLGYGPQKQLAMEKVSHEWGLLLDADEELTPGLAAEIQDMLSVGTVHDGFELPRREQMYWRMASPLSCCNFQLRLFRRAKSCMSKDAVHADPQVTGTVGKMRNHFYHYGDSNLHIQELRINRYSTGLVEEKVRKKTKGALVASILYPLWVFFHIYIIKRHFLSGVAGFFSAAMMGHYAFLKYAKLYENRQVTKYGTTKLPKNAPDLLRPPEVPL